MESKYKCICKKKLEKAEQSSEATQPPWPPGRTAETQLETPEHQRNTRGSTFYPQGSKGANHVRKCGT